MRRRLVLLAVAAQLAVLAAMAGQREYIRAFGERIHLRTAPIDPRDPFRGDFVRLHYALNNPAPAQMRPSQLDKGQRVYAGLRPTRDGLHELDHLDDTPPDTGLFLRGRSRYTWQAPGVAWIEYGIEQYFVQQGHGKAIEARRGRRDGVQVPMEVELALGGSGSAVLRGYRWSPLGVELSITRPPARLLPGEAPADDQPRSPALRLALHNVSDAPLLLADPGPHCGFTLVGVGAEIAAASPDACRGLTLQPEQLIRLAPGEHYAAEIDLAAPRWWVRVPEQEAPGELAVVAQNQNFRLVYRAPEAALRLDPAVWPGSLPSPSFNAGGRID